LTVQNGTKRSTVVVVSAFWILNCAFLLSVSGCASRAKADTLAEGPPLAVPAPPVHEIVVEQVADAPPPEPPPAPDPAPPTPRPTAARPPARTEPREAPAPVPTQPAPTPPPAATEAPAVRAAPTAAAAGDEKKVRDFMAKAADDLKRVDYQRLSKEGKAQYDQSKRFSDEAQQAMKERNFLLAVTLAEKAATLAAELVR
jgi:outer membrane biosynthesis protein TonB